MNNIYATFLTVAVAVMQLVTLACTNGRVHGATPHCVLSRDRRYLKRRPAVEAVPAQAPKHETPRSA